jgi:hypothetical protein
MTKHGMARAWMIALGSAVCGWFAVLGIAVLGVYLVEGEVHIFDGSNNGGRSVEADDRAKYCRFLSDSLAMFEPPNPGPQDYEERREFIDIKAEQRKAGCV